MMQNLNYFTTNGPMSSFFPAFGGVFILIMLWSLLWKGLALWHSGRRGQVWWFVAMLLINTMGILEIIYLFGFAKLKFEDLFNIHKK